MSPPTTFRRHLGGGGRAEQAERTSVSRRRRRSGRDLGARRRSTASSRRAHLHGRAGEHHASGPSEEQGIRGQLRGNLRAVEVPGDEHQLLAARSRTATGRRRRSPRAPGPDGPTSARVVLRDISVLQGARAESGPGKIGSNAERAVRGDPGRSPTRRRGSSSWSSERRVVAPAAPGREATDSAELVETPPPSSETDSSPGRSAKGGRP